MKEATKDALEKAGFERDEVTGIWRKEIMDNDRMQVVEFANGWARWTMAEGHLPLAIAALTTPATHALTDEERESLEFAIESVEFERFGERDTTRHPDMHRIEKTLRNLLARSESAPTAELQPPSSNPRPVTMHATQRESGIPTLDENAPTQPPTPTRDERLARVAAIEGKYAHVPVSPEPDTLTDAQLARVDRMLDAYLFDAAVQEAITVQKAREVKANIMDRLRNRSNQEGE